MERTNKVGWGGGGKFHHLVVRLDEPKSPEKVACGAKIGLIAGRQPVAGGPCCVKCTAYARKRRWS